ncbi:MAG: hypothetical protein K1Y36_05205 [Blastocatellia bacterium]|nr:hypothetical protein [Blastocatellia bacterium]
MRLAVLTALLLTVVTTLSLTRPQAAPRQVSQKTPDRRQLAAEIRTDHELFRKSERQNYEAWQVSPTESQNLVTVQPADVLNYKLALQVAPGTTNFIGTVDIKAAATSNNFSTFLIDLDRQLNVDSLKVSGVTGTTGFERNGNQISVRFGKPLAAGTEFTVTIAYSGSPRSFSNLSNGGAVFFTTHQGTPIIATLSEPYGSPAWWPCVDNPADKATVQMAITVPDPYVAASNGTLTEIREEGNGRKTYLWDEKYPISPYLVSLAVTNYKQFQDTYTALDGTKMPLTYFVYPEHFDIAQQKFAITRKAMEIFAPLYGEYPFLKEKYGMAEFPWGGGMEHQTLTSLGGGIVASGGSSQSIIAHELAHQWWGDNVTCGRWNDIWLNEGFATYSEVLFFEKNLKVPAGDLMVENYDDGRANGALRGTVIAEDLADPFDDTNAVYDKGAWVLHMLRGLMGDDNFFKMLREYRQRHAYGNATTPDFQNVCELAYGAPLGDFFNQWVYSQLRPTYAFSYDSKPDGNGGYTIFARIDQKQTHSLNGEKGVSTYKMPLLLTVTTEDGKKQQVTVFNRFRSQVFALQTTARPRNVQFDADSFVLKEMTQATGSVTAKALSMTATASTVTGKAPLQVEFSGTAGGATLPDASMSWATEKKVLGQGAKLTYTFDRPGVYEVTLTGVNKKVASTSTPLRITVTE